MSNPQTKDKDAKDKKVRVFALAKELNLETKTLLDYAKELGFAEIKNQLSGLAPEQAEALKERVKKGPRPGTPRAPAPIPAKPVIPPVAKDSKIQTIPKAKPAAPRPAPEELAEFRGEEQARRLQVRRRVGRRRLVGRATGQPLVVKLSRPDEAVVQSVVLHLDRLAEVGEVFDQPRDLA